MAVKSMTDRLNVTCAYELGATFLAVAQLPFCMCVCVGDGGFFISFICPFLLLWFGASTASLEWKLQVLRGYN